MEESMNLSFPGLSVYATHASSSSLPPQPQRWDKEPPPPPRAEARGRLKSGENSGDEGNVRSGEWVGKWSGAKGTSRAPEEGHKWDSTGTNSGVMWPGGPPGVLGGQRLFLGCKWPERKHGFEDGYLA